MLQVIPIKAKSIFSRSRIPSCDFVVNPYVGCEHACLYCYAKFVCKWKNYGSWGSWVEVKENAAELVKGKYVNGTVYMASVSDAYQPIEKELELTRKILENMDKKISLAILTKSDLVVRDVDIFKKFKSIEVGLTINGFDENVRKVLEPRASDHDKRVNALHELHENRIKNYAFISPFIPELVDLEALIKETRDFVDEYWVEFLNLRAAGEEFRKWLAENHPYSYKALLSKEKMEKLFYEVRTTLKKCGVNVAGIVTHHAGFKIITT